MLILYEVVNSTSLLCLKHNLLLYPGDFIMDLTILMRLAKNIFKWSFFIWVLCLQNTCDQF